ncbi:helix-turn-helix domain-containing protein [Persicobacter diffluens]|uniref:Transposase IS30-like HTH domain-containing protein n=1 Tax=Persicobacter diffluens TaxID=981 RepID=A0AAN4W396_9BACT|nr:hypothetical protein PEDI_44530 [Persicobacter diffluens]
MYLTYQERCKLAAWHHLGMSNATIARMLKRHPATIGRELKRNRVFGTYQARLAQRRYECRKIFVGTKSFMWCGFFRNTPYQMDAFQRRITQWFSDAFDDYARLRMDNWGKVNFNLIWRHQVRMMKIKGPLWYGQMARWIHNIWDLEEEAIRRRKQEEEQELAGYESLSKMIDETKQGIRELIEQIDKALSSSKTTEDSPLRAA